MHARTYVHRKRCVRLEEFYKMHRATHTYTYTLGSSTQLLGYKHSSSHKTGEAVLSFRASYRHAHTHANANANAHTDIRTRTQKSVSDWNSFTRCIERHTHTLSDRGSSTELQKHTLKLLLHQPDQDGQAVHMATTPPLLQHPLRTEKWPTPSQAKGFTASNTPVLY